jgi:molybdate transport system regulatory protein
VKTANPDLAEVLGQESTDKRIDILRRIGEGGSISEAARRAGVSYKAAWQAIETLGNLAGTPMVEKAVGGSGGGGAVLTPAGRRVLEAAAMLATARTEVMARLGLAAGTEAGAAGLAAMALRTSMRNQFPCEVTRLGKTGSIARISLLLPGGLPLTARLTRESAQLLQLGPGRQVLALCKATAVQVAVQVEAAEGRNRVDGIVSRTTRSAHGGEVTLALRGGVSLVGFAAAGLRLKVGDEAMAGIDESAVVVAIPG